MIQIVAAIANIEIPRNEWSELIPSLLPMVSAEAVHTKRAVLQAIGFICEILDPNILETQSNAILTAVAEGARKEQTRHENEKVALQAIEFWSTVFETEAEIQYENSQEDEPSQIFHNFATTASPELTHVLLWSMTKKEEDEDEDEWNVSMAAATCLQLLANCIKSGIVNLVLPFIQEHISNPDWKYREAAVMAFGSIIEGPEAKDVYPLVSMALPTLIQLMNDQVIHIKDTAAWTLGKICELLVDTLQPHEFQSIIQAVVVGLNDNPRVASNCAWCIINLAEQLAVESDQPTSLLDSVFPTLLLALTQAADKYFMLI